MRVVLATVFAAALLPGQDLRRLVNEAEALGARTGVLVKDLDSRHVLFEQRADEVFAPASNMKVLTAAAVLRGLGADYTFTTRFLLRDGRLVVVAGGDPNWITGTDEAPSKVFALVVAALEHAGVQRIAGIGIDDGRFTGPDRPPTWPQDQLATYYCAPTGGVVLEQGVFVLRIAPGSGDANVSIQAPPVVLPFRGAIAMTDVKKGATYGVVDLGDMLKLTGRCYQLSRPVTIRTAMHEQRTWVLHTLRQYLAAAGIREDSAAAPADQELCIYHSSLKASLQRMLEDSSNFDAEQCLRVLGAEKHGDGSLVGGLAAARAELGKLVGGLPAGIELQDGSGLSRGNRLSPSLLVTALQHALRGPGSDIFLGCLPVGGESGTLGKRFTKSPVNGRVHAKTGWIRGASALSGVLQRRDGSLRVFAILMAYDRDRGGLNPELKGLQERMVEAMDELPGQRS
jgi:D-alanyl-D-alanine carboxypeptidase/D-alanyl-D-alanine-endopeptidase (penicillin-binding protein 4)